MYFIRRPGFAGLGDTKKAGGVTAPVIPPVMNHGLIQPDLLSQGLMQRIAELGLDPAMTDQRRAGSSEGPLAAPDVDPVCACAVPKFIQYAQQQGTPPDVIQQQEASIMTLCQSDPSGFIAQTREMGTESCKPWYKQRRTWMIGGGIAAVAAAYAIFR